jgi:hypothetical protein
VAAARSCGSAKEAGSGTVASIGSPCAGLVPQVTNGRISSPSTTTSVSKVASSSERNVRQWATSASHSAPVGACGRPAR